MPSTTTVENWINEQLPAGSSVECLVIGAGKPGTKSALGSAARRTVATSALVSALGGGTLVMSAPPAQWCAVTDQDVLLFAKRKGYGRNALGQVVFSAPRDAIAARLRSGFMNSVALVDRTDGAVVWTVRFGVRRSAASRFAAACGIE